MEILAFLGLMLLASLSGLVAGVLLFVGLNYFEYRQDKKHGRINSTFQAVPLVAAFVVAPWSFAGGAVFYAVFRAFGYLFS